MRTFPICPAAWLLAKHATRALQLIREAVELHIEGLREQGEVIPEPHSFSDLVEVDAA